MTCLPAECLPLVAIISDQRHYEGQELIASCEHTDSRRLLHTLLSTGLIYSEEDHGDPDF